MNRQTLLPLVIAGVILLPLGGYTAWRLATGAPLLPSRPAPTLYTPKFITIDELLKRRDVVVVDTRTLEHYGAGHILGARSLARSAMGRGQDPRLPRDRDLVLYCACQHEEAAIDAAINLAANYGYERLLVLKGGLLEWERRQLPMER